MKTSIRLLSVLALLVQAPLGAKAETVKVGLVHNAGAGPLYIAIEKNYFTAEGLIVQTVPFGSGEPIAVAAVSGDIDLGSTGPSGGLFNLAGQGALRIIAGGTHEAPGFQMLTVVASNAAFNAGLKTLKDLAGHSAGVAQIGSTGHYSLALIEEKYRIDAKSVTVIGLQSTANVVSAVTGGKTDIAISTATPLAPGIANGATKLLAYAGDEAPFQTGVVFTATKFANTHPELIQRYLRALNKGKRDYYDAFTGPDGKRRDGPNADAFIAIIAKYVEQTPDQVRPAIAYNDAQSRLGVADILHQIAWYKSQNMVKGDFDPKSVIDMRYVVALPEK